MREDGAELADAFAGFLSLFFGDVETVSEDGAAERCAISLIGSVIFGDIGGLGKFGGLALCCSMELLEGRKKGKSSSSLGPTSSSLTHPTNFFFLNLLSLGDIDFARGAVIESLTARIPALNPPPRPLARPAAVLLLLGFDFKEVAC